LRTLALAYKDIDFTPNYETIPDTQLESDLNLICIAGIKDPLRKEIPDAIKKCRSAGITVRMVTGDNVKSMKKEDIYVNLLSYFFVFTIDKHRCSHCKRRRDYR